MDPKGGSSSPSTAKPPGRGRLRRGARGLAGYIGGFSGCCWEAWGLGWGVAERRFWRSSRAARAHGVNWYCSTKEAWRYRATAFWIAWGSSRSSFWSRRSFTRASRASSLTGTLTRRRPWRRRWRRRLVLGVEMSGLGGLDFFLGRPTVVAPERGRQGIAGCWRMEPARALNNLFMPALRPALGSKPNQPDRFRRLAAIADRVRGLDNREADLFAGASLLRDCRRRDSSLSAR